MLGLEISTEGVAIVHRRAPLGVVSTISHCEFLPFDEAGKDPESDRKLQIQMLDDKLQSLGLRQAQCNISLTSGDYQVLLVEAPKVPEAELNQALRWRIKDLVSFPIEEAAVEAFLLPEDSSRGGQRMAYAVVVRKSLIRDRIDFIAQSELTLNAIDIPELSLRNILLSSIAEEEMNRGVALVSLRQGGGSLRIYKAGNLYLSRQFKLDYNGGLLDDLPAEALALELQRSLDYYERQMRQVPPGTIYLSGENIGPDKITENLQNALVATISALDLSAIEFDAGIEEHMVPLCLSALGATMRVELN